MSEDYFQHYGKPIVIGQVRMDAKGDIGVIIGMDFNSISLQRSDRMVEFIPFDHKEIFEATTWSLGYL